MNRYAQNTSVSQEKSRAEIERVLVRYGADQFMYGWEHGQAVIGFRLNNRMIRFLLPMPRQDEPRFTQTETGRDRKPSAAHAAWEQAGRQAWRALALVIKAKLEAVESNITTFDDEFLAHIVMPNGRTIGEAITPQIEQAYQTGTMPPLLPMLGQARHKGG